MTGPREWRHAESCPAPRWSPIYGYVDCICGLSAVRDAIAAGHRVVIGPDGVEGRVDHITSHYPPNTEHHGGCRFRIVPLEEEP